MKGRGKQLQSRPLPSAWTVEAGLTTFLAENGYTAEEYDAPRTTASFLKLTFSVPNTPKHRWAIMRHDLHHVATGYGTSPQGEGEISAWELRRGIRPLGLYVGAIVIGGALLGLLVAPRRTIRAWRASGRSPTLFHLHECAYEHLLAMTLGELRAVLDLPDEGLATAARRNHSLAPSNRQTLPPAV